MKVCQETLNGNNPPPSVSGIFLSLLQACHHVRNTDIRDKSAKTIASSMLSTEPQKISRRTSAEDNRFQYKGTSCRYQQEAARVHRYVPHSKQKKEKREKKKKKKKKHTQKRRSNRLLVHQVIYSPPQLPPPPPPITPPPLLLPFLSIPLTFVFDQTVRSRRSLPLSSYMALRSLGTDIRHHLK